MMSAPRERQLSTERVYEGRVVSLRVERVQLPSGRVTVREIVEHRGAVAMVPLLSPDTLLLVRQYRRAVDQELLEIPAGTLEPGEEVEACLQRELAEEIGHRAGRFSHLVNFLPSPGFLTEVLYVYLAEALAPHRLEAEEEDLRVEQVPLARARALIDEGVIRDAKSIIGILLTMERLARRSGA
ncbi:MAG: NUDIX hydrolase [Armatimonadetes bacterium]|nr:NUDIX hydrolase [Armatimonadota bacterium]